MKKLLLVLLFLPLMGWTQEDTTKIFGVGRIEVLLPLDTIPCIMLVCDTSSVKSNSNIQYDEITGYNYNLKLKQNRTAYWQKGYSVREKTCYWDSPDAVNGKISTGVMRKERFTHLYYLDSDKKRLSNDIIVWMSVSSNKKGE
jgi:hypothetical protein